MFLEQIRIVRELREEDKRRGRTNELVRPRFMLWENVCGAFSSNKGRDFQRVLSECVRIAEPSAPDVPIPEKGWTKAGSLMGDGFSIAWRVLDAQYWGVPQRRRRIALVCDFGGGAAGEILFDEQGVSGHYPESGKTGKRVAGAFETCAYPAIARSLTARYDGSPCINRGPNVIVQAFGETGQGYWQPGIKTLRAEGENRPSRPSNVVVIPIHDKATRCQGGGSTRNGDGAGNGLGVERDGDPCPTLTAADKHAVLAVQQNQAGEVRIAETAYTLNTNANATGRNSPLLYDAIGRARRFTPLEEERLQGFPDHWTDIECYVDGKGKKRKTSDSARYRALGNSIALPPWRWVLSRIAAQYDGAATLGSLFDGISGFPLLWEEINGKGSAVFASEIDPFCIAVAKARIG